MNIYNVCFYCYSHTNLEAHSVTVLVFETFLTFTCPSKKAAAFLFSQQLPAKPKPSVFCPSISLLDKRESDSDRLMHSMTRQDLAPSRIN